MENNGYQVSAAALHAAKTLLQNFTFAERPGGRTRATELNIAILIDVCTHAFRLERVLDRVVREVPWANRESLAKNLDQMREAVRAIEMIRNSMPRYQTNDLHVVKDLGPGGPPELTRAQREQLHLVGKAVQQAKTVEEETNILRAAGLSR